MAIVDESFRLTGLFEAEVLVELMLRFWVHPFANDEEFRNTLLENAAEALKQAKGGSQLIKELPANQTNLIAALWYAEWSSLQGSGDSETDRARRSWLDQVRRGLPSCFCNPEELA